MYQEILSTNIINFVIVLAVLYFVVAKMPILKAIFKPLLHPIKLIFHFTDFLKASIEDTKKEIIAFKTPLDLLSEEIQSIKANLEHSDEEKQNAIRKLNEALENAKNLPIELEKIKIETRKILENLEAKKQDEILELNEQLDKNAAKIMTNETEKVLSDVRKELSTNSIVLAQEKIKQSLNQNPELHRKFINQAIAELEKMEL